MEDVTLRMRVRRDPLESVDYGALARIVRIPCRGEHDTKRRAAIPFRHRLIERATDAGVDQVDQSRT